MPVPRMMITWRDTRSIFFTTAAGSQSFQTTVSIQVDSWWSGDSASLGGALSHQAEQKAFDKDIVGVIGVEPFEFAYCLGDQTKSGVGKPPGKM